MTLDLKEHPDFLDRGARHRNPSSLEIDRPPWSLVLFCVLLFAIPPNLVLQGFFLNISTPARLIATFLLASLVVDFIHLPQYRRTGATVSLNLGIVLLLFYLSLMFIIWGLGLLSVGTPTQELVKPTAISSVIIVVGIGMRVITNASTQRNRSLVLGFLLLGVTYSAIVGLLQHTLQIDYSELLKPSGFEMAPGIRQKTEAMRLGVLRATGTQLDYLPFGATCASAVPIAIHFVRYSTSPYRRLLSGVSLAILLAAVPASVSRSSLIALAISVGFYMAFLTLRRIATILSAFLGIFVLFLLVKGDTLQALWDTIINSSDDPSVLVRFTQIETMINVFHQHPIAGLGLGAITPTDFGPVDNYLVLSLAEGGILAIVAFSALAVGGIFGIATAIRRSGSDEERDQKRAVGAAFLGLLSTTPTFAALSFDPQLSLFFLMFGMIWSGCSLTVARPNPAGAGISSPSFFAHDAMRRGEA